MHKRGGSQYICIGALRLSLLFAKRALAEPRRQPASRPRRVLAGGEVAGGGELAKHDLQSP
jgi:hypothetical protein